MHWLLENPNANFLTFGTFFWLNFIKFTSKIQKDCFFAGLSEGIPAQLCHLVTLWL